MPTTVATRPTTTVSGAPPATARPHFSTNRVLLMELKSGNMACMQAYIHSFRLTYRNHKSRTDARATTAKKPQQQQNLRMCCLCLSVCERKESMIFFCSFVMITTFCFVWEPLDTTGKIGVTHEDRVRGRRAGPNSEAKSGGSGKLSVTTTVGHPLSFFCNGSRCVSHLHRVCRYIV